MVRKRAVFDVEGLQRQDPTVWSTYYAELREMADAYLQRHFASSRQIHDIRDEAIGRLYQAVPNLRDRSKFRPFYYEILYRTANEFRRIEERTRTAERMHDQVRRISERPYREEELGVLLIDLKKAFEALTPLHQEICALRYQKITWDQIGKALRKSYKTLVKEFDRLNRELAHLCLMESLQHYPKEVCDFFAQRAEELFDKETLASMKTEDEMILTPERVPPRVMGAVA